MEKKSYSDKLKDPRWQKKRLEVLQSAGFRCESCFTIEDALNVHHIYYEKDRAPWDYSDDAYLVLCDKCHKRWHNLKFGLDRALCMMTIDQLHDIVSMVTELGMMGPSDTAIFKSLITGYHWKKCDEIDESDDSVVAKSEMSF